MNTLPFWWQFFAKNPFVTLSKIERGRSFLPTSAISLLDYICRADHTFILINKMVSIRHIVTYATVVVTGFKIFSIFSLISNSDNVYGKHIKVMLFALQYSFFILSFNFVVSNLSIPPKCFTGS